VGLSELTALPDGSALVLERDDQRDRDAAVKRLYRVALSDTEPAAELADAPVVAKELVADLLPELAAALPGAVPDKPEGVALGADGQLYVVTDNDGVVDVPGATVLLRLGDLDRCAPASWWPPVPDASLRPMGACAGPGAGSSRGGPRAGARCGGTASSRARGRGWSRGAPRGRPLRRTGRPVAAR
jgi:hypothetical protein